MKSHCILQYIFSEDYRNFCHHFNFEFKSLFEFNFKYYKINTFVIKNILIF